MIRCFNGYLAAIFLISDPLIFPPTSVFIYDGVSPTGYPGVDCWREVRGAVVVSCLPVQSPRFFHTDIGGLFLIISQSRREIYVVVIKKIISGSARRGQPPTSSSIFYTKSHCSILASLISSLAFRSETILLHFKLLSSSNQFYDSTHSSCCRSKEPKEVSLVQWCLPLQIEPTTQ